jgi:hypothetical protein
MYASQHLFSSIFFQISIFVVVILAESIMEQEKVIRLPAKRQEKERLCFKEIIIQ